MPAYPRHPSTISLAISLCIAGFAQAAAQTNGTVSGKVVDSAGRGNESVKITLYDGDKQLATGYTDSDGKFTLNDVPPGKGYTIVAVRQLRVATMSGKKADVSVKRGETTDVGNIELQMGGPG